MYAGMLLFELRADFEAELPGGHIDERRFNANTHQFYSSNADRK